MSDGDYYRNVVRYTFVKDNGCLDDILFLLFIAAKNVSLVNKMSFAIMFNF